MDQRKLIFVKLSPKYVLFIDKKPIKEPHCTGNDRLDCSDQKALHQLSLGNLKTVVAFFHLHQHMLTSWFSILAGLVAGSKTDLL